MEKYIRDLTLHPNGRVEVSDMRTEDNITEADLTPKELEELNSPEGQEAQKYARELVEKAWAEGRL